MDLPRATNTSALSGAGVMRLFNKVGETVNKITYKMDENDSVRSQCQIIVNIDTSYSHIAFQNVHIVYMRISLELLILGD